MSAIWMKCQNCEGVFVTGMVGSTLWPAHIYPDGTRGADAEFFNPLEENDGINDRSE
jgi:hypothetical protein